MKFLIVLALALAVSNAAFTGSLVQQAQPLVKQIKADFTLNIKARSSAEIGLQTSFGTAIQDHINGVLAQIESTINDAQNTASEVATSILAAVAQLQTAAQSLGADASGVAASFAQQVQGVLSGLFGNLFGSNTRASLQLNEDILNLITFYLGQANVQAAIQENSLFQCVNGNLPAPGLTLSLLSQLNEENNLNVDYLLNHPAIAPCIAAEGGIVFIIQNSPIVAYLQNLVISMGLQEVVRPMIIEILGPVHGPALLALLNLKSTDRASIQISAQILALIHHYLGQANVQAAIQGSSVFQCVNSNLPAPGLTLALLSQLNQNNNLNVAYLLNHPAIAPCIAAEGGLAAMIQNSAIVAFLKNLVNTMGLQDVVREQILQLLGPVQGQALLALLSSTNNARASIQITAELQGMIHYFLGTANVQAAIAGSALYQCINLNLQPVGGLTLQFLSNLNANDNLNVDYLLSSPAVAPCIQAQGGLTAIIQSSSIVAHLQQLVQSLNLQEVVRAKILELLGEEYGNQLLALLSLKNRGLFDGLGQVWGTISGQVSSVGAMLAGIASQTWTNMQEKFEMVQAIASAFIAGGLDTAQDMGLQAAQNLIDTLTPYRDDLGVVYHDTVTQLQTIYHGLIVPTFA